MVQGAGLGFLIVPLSAATLSTLPVSERTDCAGFFSLSRNIGSSVGISPHVNAVNRGFDSPMVAQMWNPATAAGRAAIDAVVTRQAEIIAYIDDYKFLMLATIAVIPLLLVFKRPPAHRPPAEHLIVD
jgi:DHA2 family multidrug resistance protein